ncbi:MAG: ribonuclease P protein component [Candidatus Paceibacterota bacterium]|jgi:ribonuclease P protein component
MLPKKNRADKKAVEKIFKEGKFVNSPNLTFKFVIRGENDFLMSNTEASYSLRKSFSPRVSVVVPKSVAKLAVKRNSLRRLLYSILIKYIKDLPVSLVGVFIFKKAENDVTILENEIKTIFNKIR